MVQIRKLASEIMGSYIISIASKTSPKQLKKLLESQLDALKSSGNYRERQSYLVICQSVLQANRDLFKLAYAPQLELHFRNERITCVRQLLAQICVESSRTSPCL